MWHRTPPHSPHNSRPVLPPASNTLPVMTTPLRRILVVEDEAAIAGAVAARLRAEGFGVEVAGDGAAAIAAVRRLRPDLVVLDIMLPGMDGLEVCRRIQADRPVP